MAIIPKRSKGPEACDHCALPNGGFREVLFGRLGDSSPRPIPKLFILRLDPATPGPNSVPDPQSPKGGATIDRIGPVGVTFSPGLEAFARTGEGANVDDDDGLGKEAVAGVVEAKAEVALEVEKADAGLEERKVEEEVEAGANALANAELEANAPPELEAPKDELDEATANGDVAPSG